MRKKNSNLDEQFVSKIESKKLTKQDLKEIEMTMKEDFPEYWKWRSKYNSFGMIAIVLVVIEVFLLLVLMGIIPLVDITPGNETAQRLVFGLIIVFVLFFMTNIITAYFAYKFAPYSHVKELMALMKEYYPQELVAFDIPKAMGIDIKAKKEAKKK